MFQLFNLNKTTGLIRIADAYPTYVVSLPIVTRAREKSFHESVKTIVATAYRVPRPQGSRATQSGSRLVFIEFGLGHHEENAAARV
jgi:hypothetical protein